jgi:protocatechuate 3,4-dioxygenase beta subunit
MSLTMNVVDAAGQPLTGAAVYIWHCSRDGNYSAYSSGMNGGDYADRSYLRGVQVSDRAGAVTFETILPGRYSGRAFHIHFEVYEDDTYGTKLLTSQMAMDDDLIDSLYSAADGYDTSIRNDTDNAQDNVFRDGVDHQMLTVSGDANSGLTATFTAVV